MSHSPKSLFDTYDSFLDQDFSNSEPTTPCVKAYLASFPPALEAPRGYLAVRSFLRAFSDNAQTFSSYRIHIERLLLWSLLINQKPLNQLKRQDAQDYLSFCRNPPRVWIGSVTRSRFVKNTDAQSALEDPIIPNPNWRPFNIKSSKPLIGFDDQEQGIIENKYSATNSTINQVFSICSRFFEFMVEDGYAAANPFRMIKKSGRYSDDVQDEGVTRALTPLQWNYVLETAEKLAESEPARHERTL